MTIFALAERLPTSATLIYKVRGYERTSKNIIAQMNQYDLSSVCTAVLIGGLSLKIQYTNPTQIFGQTHPTEPKVKNTGMAMFSYWN